MVIVEGLAGLRSLRTGAVASIGNFDGVHRGHRRLLELADHLRPDSPGGVAVVTFEPHPLTVLRPGEAPVPLTPLAVKKKVLADLGVDTLVLLPPTPQVLDLSAEQFWRILVEDVRPAHLVEGSSFFFGKGRGGTIQKLAEWSASSDIKLHVADAVEVVLLDLSIVRVSSSLVRWLVGHGRVRDAAICLGRPYLLQGRVVKGHQRGRTIGVPTANLDITEQLVPADGVYAGRATVDGAVHPAAVSIGTLPTFEGAARQIEAHLMGFSGDLYERVIDVELTDWLREQRRYHGVDPLKRQIALDLQEVSARVSMDATRELGTIAMPS